MAYGILCMCQRLNSIHPILRVFSPIFSLHVKNNWFYFPVGLLWKYAYWLNFFAFKTSQHANKFEPWCHLNVYNVLIANFLKKNTKVDFFPSRLFCSKELRLNYHFSCYQGQTKNSSSLVKLKNRTDEGLKQ